CKWPSPPRSPYASTGCVRRRRRLRLFSKTHGPNVIRRFHGASAPTLRVHQHPAPRQYRQPRPLGVGGAPTAPALVHQHRSRRLHEPPDDRSRSPGGQPAPETPGCTSYACPTYGHPSRGTSSPTSQVSTIRGQPHIPTLISTTPTLTGSRMQWIPSASDQNRTADIWRIFGRISIICIDRSTAEN